MHVRPEVDEHDLPRKSSVVRGGELSQPVAIESREVAFRREAGVTPHGTGSSQAPELEDCLRERLRRFLRQVVPDPALERPVRVRA